MKKILILTLALILALSLAACNGGGSTFTGVDTSRSSATSGGSAPEPGDTSEPNTSQSSTISNPQSASQPPATSKPPSKSKPTDPPVSGNTGSMLVGTWRCNRTISGSTGTITALYQFYFNGDGSFKYYYIPGAYTYEYNGKYSASDGKVYLYDIKRLINPDEGEDPVNKTMEYALGTDDTGVYLAIGLMNTYTDKTYVEVPNNVKFRKSNT